MRLALWEFKWELDLTRLVFNGIKGYRAWEKMMLCSTDSLLMCHISKYFLSSSKADDALLSFQVLKFKYEQGQKQQ